MIVKSSVPAQNFYNPPHYTFIHFAAKSINQRKFYFFRYNPLISSISVFSCLRPFKKNPALFCAGQKKSRTVRKRSELFKFLSCCRAWFYNSTSIALFWRRLPLCRPAPARRNLPLPDRTACPQSAADPSTPFRQAAPPYRPCFQMRR